MGFLDSLENSLNSLEKVEERDPLEVHRRNSKREAEKKSALAVAPVAEELRTSKFTMDLLTHATRIGHGNRVAVQMVWLGYNLRLQARDRRLELQPTPEGVIAVFSEGGSEKGHEVIDLQGDPEKLAQKWLAGMPQRNAGPAQGDNIEVG